MTVVHVLEPFASGVTTAVISIAKKLPALKHVVVHGSRMWVDEIDRVKGKFPPAVEFIPWPHAGREISLSGDLRALCSLLKILRPYKNRDAVIHLHSSKAGFLGRLACRILGIRQVIYTPHCGAFVRTDIGRGKRRLFRLLERIGGAFGGTVVGCGRSEAELYDALGGARRQKARWVSNGVEIRPLGKEADPRLVSFTGIAGVQKDPEMFNRIALENPALPFCWIGEGPLKDRLSAANITVTGWLDTEGVQARLAKTLVFLSCSAWEGLPFGVLEAMGSGCALLLRDVPGNRDLALPGENGYLFSDDREASELLKKMAGDREKTLSMGRKSRELAETLYSVEQMGREYGEIYAALAAGESL